ncbi:SIMPL domain-containing protein [Candidatus Campbellbacteria bacterium]|nr:MAG: SIMPL domain-containing protein [Candidatus Campbellbacteria bacterium]
MYPHTRYTKGMTTGVVVLGMLLLAGVITVAIIREKLVAQDWQQVTITGTGKVPYTPDQAIITLGVHVDNAATAQAALTKLSDVTSKVIPALTALGIPTEDISTQAYNLLPQYYYPDGKPGAISGYSADQQLNVKLTLKNGTSDERVGKVIETANAQGVNQVMGVSFTASNVQDLQQQALLKAIQDAKSRAQTTAETAGVTLKKVVSWWENPINVPGLTNPQYSAMGGGMGGGDAGVTPTVPSGTQEVIVQVNLNYSIK